ncbi:MAG: uracil phosphoribosyltransferase [Armatimonadetes bacterium]|nr:uracil phosphoribosyltransferase [Armatimonadota bacterium]
MAVIVVDHPLAKHLLSNLRDKTTSTAAFRHMSRALSAMIILEATRSMGLEPWTVETPVQETTESQLSQGLAIVPVLRAGLGMMESALDLFPDVAVGYVGLERDETTAIARSYYTKLPDLRNRYTICVDPMLATGGSASQALSVCKSAGANPLVYACIIAAPEGIDKVEGDHPDVPIYAAAVDSHLNDHKYIVPGLGDFGDRLFGTA